MLSSETFSTGKTVNYSYNGSGNRASMTETENGQSTVTKYVYDALNRLTRHYTESPNGDTDRTYYSYDEDGNLILRSRENATTGTATNTFSFGTSSPSVDIFKYNGYGEMSQAVVGGVTTNYTYYADGLRRTKTTNGVTTVHMWDEDNIIADLDGNYALKTGYARAHDLSTMYNADGDEWYYIMSDRGDTIQMYNDTSEMNYLYDAYGNQQTETTTDINPFRYSGEYYDAETGFIYLRARYYDSTIGRFISEDPIRDGLNWYVYCGNNPIVFVDPWGLKYIPLRETVDMLGGTVDKWDQNAKAATVTINGKTSTFVYNPYAYEEGDIDPIIVDSSMYVDDIEFYRIFGTVAYKNQDDSKVIIISQNYGLDNVTTNIGEKDFVVIDYRRREDNNPAMEVRECYKATTKQQRYQVIDILLSFENEDPTAWSRSRDSLEWEWGYHAAFSFWPIIGDNGKDAMLDNDGGN